MKEFIPGLNLSSTTVHCTLLQCFWIAFIISPVPPPARNSPPVHGSAQGWRQLLGMLCIPHHLCTSLKEFQFTPVLYGEPSVIMSCKRGKIRGREMNSVHEFSAAHGRRERPSQLPTWFWVGLYFNWISGEKKKSFDWLKLMAMLAEAMDSLQHSHMFQF